MVFWEYNPKDVDKIRAKSQEFAKEREEHPERFPKTLFPLHTLGSELPTLTKEIRAFNIVESDDPQTVINVIARWFPELSFKTVPIVESAKITEAIMKLKK